jgi:uncharacterized protein YggE
MIWKKGIWKRGLTALAAAALLFAGGAAALRPAPAARAQGVDLTAHTITVTGSDQEFVAPDQAQVTVGVHTTAATAAGAQSADDKAAQAVISAVEALGVSQDDIRTAWYDLSPNYAPGGPDRPSRLSGFQATDQLTVTIRDVSQVGAVIDAAVAAGANQVDGVSYTVSDPGKVQRQSYAAALQDARARADAIAQSAGVQIAGLYAVDASSSSWNGPVPFAAQVTSAAPAAPVQPGKQAIQTRVKAVYAFVSGS